MTEPRRIYIIAGEPSGDRLGAGLMAALHDQVPATFHGVGGIGMQAAGLEPLFDMSELTVMGLSEVLPKLPNLMRRIRQTAEDAVRHKPDVLITIDSPDFSLRVAAKARRALPGLRVVHYVAPSVWAWRPGRAVKMARHVNHVLALLPFEPPYMHAAGMTCDFVGHPSASWPRPRHDAVMRNRGMLGLRPGQKALLMALGSRRGEVRRLGPVFLETAARLRRSIPDLALICPVAETVRDEVHAITADLPGTVRLLEGLTDRADKMLAFASADAALCASGTVTLELAAAGTPMVAAYRTTWLTAQIVRRLIRVNTANLINLISGQSVVPEFLQEFCTPQALEGAVLPLLQDEAAAWAQRGAFDAVMTTLGRDGTPPDQRAAASVLAFINGEVYLPGETGLTLTAPPGPKDRHLGRG